MRRIAHLVLVRHGQSQWNKENRFTGWVDVDLSQEGIEECRETAKKFSGIRFDAAFTSELMRGWRSLDVILEELGQSDISIMRSAALNERHYGDLQGMNKDEARQRFGAEQIHRWRRGYYDRPPQGENLEDVYNRVVPFFRDFILHELQKGRNVIVVAHGNSLRALVKHLERLGEEEIMDIEFSTGEPIFYRYASGDFLKVL